MKYYLSNASLLKKRDWQFLPWKEDVKYPYKQDGNRYLIGNKSIAEIVKLAALLIHKNELDLIVAESGNNRIFVDGYLNARKEAVVWVTLTVCCKKAKNTREYVIGLYGGSPKQVAEYEGCKGKDVCHRYLKRKTLGSKYPLV